MSSPEQLDLERSEKLPLRPLHEKGKTVAALEIDDHHGGREANASPSVVAASATGLAPYFKLLWTNAPFARLYAGELLNSAGQWFSYVSTLRIVNEASAASVATAASAAAGSSKGASSSSSLSPHSSGGGGGSASAIGVVVAIHYLPSFFLSPIAGVVADRLPRENVLAAASLTGAAAAALLGAVQARLGVPFFLLLLSVQYSASAFYDPARRAITPSLVGFDEGALVLATTLDTVCWSTMTSVGASLGGVALSRLGARWCFFLDSLTYLAATAAALSLRGCVKKRAVGVDGGGGVGVGGQQQQQQQQQLEPAPRGLPSRMRKAKTSFRGEIGEETGGAASEEAESSSSSDSDREQGKGRHRHHLPSSSLAPSPLRGNNNDNAAAAAGAKAAPPSPFLSSSSAAAQTSSPSPSPSPSPSSVAALAATALRAAAADVRDGLRFAGSHPHVLALTTLKLSGTLVWGAADVMNVKLSDTPSLAVKKKQKTAATAKAEGDGELIDSAATLGFIFAAVGVGAMFGSVASNALTSPDARSLLRSAAAAFGLLTLGYASLSAAAAWSSLAAVLAATAARAAGSAVLWTYSTLLLQVEVPDALLGRTCALEQALYTLGECFSAMAAGLLFDAAAAAKAAAAAATKAASKAAAGATNEDVSVEAAAALMALVAGAFWAFWASYVRLHEKRRAK